ncbi:hypothetical protein BH10BAC3_BH10BAC3_38440 [soil metagenome]
MQTDVMNDAQMLHQIARDYVINGLGTKNFDAIPYDDNVILRAPICPGGSEIPLIGKENLRNIWWAPLPSLVGKVELIDSYTNKENTAVSVEFHCEILNPACVLRVIDRFIINEEGRIISQENFFDPRAVTNPA